MLASIIYNYGKFCDGFKSTLKLGAYEQHREREITDTDVVYGIAEGYANTGFAVMEKMILDIRKYDEETLIYELIQKLDDEIREILS